MSLITIKKTFQPTTPISSAKPSVEESPIWTKTALDMIKKTKNKCTPQDVREFEHLIHVNQERINDRTYAANSTILHELGKNGAPLPFLSPLIRHGIDFSVQDTFLKNTALIWALANGRNDMAKEMLLQLPLSQVASLDKQCGLGNTALHLIIGKGYTTHTKDGAEIFCSSLELIHLAIDRGANINLPNYGGNTPLHLAYARRDYDMIKLLLDNGANPNYFNNEGLKPKEMLQMGTNEDENFNRANHVLDDTVGYYFLLKENNYKSTENLKAILSL